MIWQISGSSTSLLNKKSSSVKTVKTIQDDEDLRKTKEGSRKHLAGNNNNFDLLFLELDHKF